MPPRPKKVPTAADIIGNREFSKLRPFALPVVAMKSLVTGAGGFVGPHLRDHLIQLGDEVIAVDLGSGPDLRDTDGWIAKIAADRPDVIYHLAGLSNVGASWEAPVSTFEINTIGTVSVLEAARLAGTGRVVVISSADVYGRVTPDVLPLTEQHPVQPRSPYGASKQAAEAIAQQYHRGLGLDIVIARPFNHLGPGQSPQFVAPAFAGQIAEAEQDGTTELRHGDLSPHRDLTDVRDVVRAYALLATDGEPGEIYNVCSGQTVSMQHLLDSLLALSDARIRQVLDQSLIRPVDLPVLRGSFAKLRSATGWEPEIHLDRTLTDVLADARHRQAVGLSR
jgi:GDP-4-dehydro-6-deoxy-D-mannose reductase